MAVNQIKSENMTVDLSQPKIKDWDFVYYFNEYNLRQDTVDSKSMSYYFQIENVKA